MGEAAVTSPVANSGPGLESVARGYSDRPERNVTRTAVVTLPPHTIFLVLEEVEAAH
jgi:hypothetical protein